MDENIDLIITKTVRKENWEDQERANDDVKLLMAEFDKRLPTIAPSTAGDAGDKSK
jgi:hypothetical protein